MRVNIPLSRRVNITEIDKPSEEFQIEFIENRRIVCQAKIQMGPMLHQLTQHWLLHQDDLFSDVFARYNG